MVPAGAGLTTPGRFAFGPGVDDALAEIEKIAAQFPPADVAGSRMYARAMNRLSGPVPELHEVANLVIPRRLGGIGLRLYRPGAGRRPVVLFLHGGWFFSGDLETHDTLCRSLAEASGYVVLAVHYRRAPEHTCPAAPDDCLETVQWIVDHADELAVDPTAFAVVGDGAGAALAAITTCRARDAGGPAIRAQVLLYPVISTRQDSPSWRALVGAPIVSVERAQYAWSMYTPPGCHAAPEVRAPEAITDLAGLPPALVITAEYDPLHAEGEAHAARLQQAGVPAQVHRYLGMIHGFVGLAGVVPAGREAITEVAGWLRSTLGGPTTPVN